MFLYLLDFLSDINQNFMVLEYITLRSILSIITALSISLFLGPFIINKFQITRKKMIANIHYAIFKSNLSLI